MPAPNKLSLPALVAHFAEEVRKKFSVSIDFNPEDQLKTPVCSMFQEIAKGIEALSLETVTEVHVSEVSGRPDIGVLTNSLLNGHIELKAPGKGARTEKFKGADQTQWHKFKDLPNLIYTDGNEWALYRTGELVGKIVRFSGDITDDGSSAITPANAENLLMLIRDFLSWCPIVPKTPASLAKLLAPLCRLLRYSVLETLQDTSSDLVMLASDWRKFLFPNADDAQFADAYAQTLTYALLLARLSGTNHDFGIPSATKSLYKGHRLLSDALKILGDDQARQDLGAPIGLIERVIAAIDDSVLFGEGETDPWLYFYEDFLAEYDPSMRKERGVYYTPVQVVQAQINLVGELLKKRFSVEFSFVDPKVITLDPAAGTGTYIATALRHGFEKIARVKGQGMRSNAASQAAKNIYAFELLVGPYAVAHLRLTQEILAEKGKLPEDGVNVYLTDTLESPNHPPPDLPFSYRELGREHERARKVKAEVPVLVCIGNPPYDRQQIDEEQKAITKRKGGWVRFGEPSDGNAVNDKPRTLLQDFLDPLEPLGYGVHAKNLYNDYVYFWRWALWKVFHADKSQGIISFITASSYLRGPGFAGMRQVMRSTFSDLWIIDLGGDNLGARKSENVFAIQTPVAIAIGVKNKAKKADTPAIVRYSRIDGSQEEKLDVLAKIKHFKDLDWHKCLSDWTEPFLPTSDNAYWEWPLITDLFPWQENGMQFKRTWPIAETPEILKARWDKFLESNTDKKRLLFRETRDRKIDRQYYPIGDKKDRERKLSMLKGGFPSVKPINYAYRSFDRQWCILDSRLCDFPRPDLHKAHGDKQIYLTSLLTKVLGEGPSATATNLIPDMDFFSGRGAKDVIPLWRDREGTDANITAGVLGVLKKHFKLPVSPEDFFAYCYAILASPYYAKTYWDELTIPGPRIPITKTYNLFTEAVSLGSRLLWLHTYGERFVQRGKQLTKVPKGKAKCKHGTSSNPKNYPETFSYDPIMEQLTIGDSGVFNNVREDVWGYSVSGLQVVKSWLDYRMKDGSGKKSSELDKIRPSSWTFDDELLELLWVLDATIDLVPSIRQVTKRIFKGKVFEATAFRKPSELERNGPANDAPLLATCSPLTDNAEDL